MRAGQDRHEGELRESTGRFPWCRIILIVVSLAIDQIERLYMLCSFEYLTRVFNLSFVVGTNVHCGFSDTKGEIVRKSSCLDYILPSQHVFRSVIVRSTRRAQ